jgi:hypothetical protein
MCGVDILGTHIVSVWYSLENRVLQLSVFVDRQLAMGVPGLMFEGL